MLPRWETPEHTEGYEGFYHLVSIEGTVEKTVITYIIRDFDQDRFIRRKKNWNTSHERSTTNSQDAANLK